MENILKEVEDNGKIVDGIVKDIIKDTTEPLDNYVETVKQCFANQVEILDNDLRAIMMEIPKLTYGLIVLMQQIEARKGLAKEQAVYAKNDALLQATGTVQQKEAHAENQTASNRLVQIAYNTAASILSKKVEAAMSLADSAKRVLSSRDKEKALTGLAGNSVGTF